MISEVFSEGTSPVHLSDPRIRLVSAVVFSFLISILSGFLSMSAALFFSMALCFSAKLNLAAVVKRLSVLAGFLILVWAFLPVTTDGEPLISLGPVVFTKPGVLFAAAITLKSAAIILVFMALVATMSVAVLGQAMSFLRFPEKVIFLILMTYRYIFVLHDEYLRLRTAAKIRGFSPGTNVHSYKTYGWLVGMLFVRASVRAENVHRAMLCRGFDGRFHCLGEFAPYAGNKFLIAGVAAAVGCVACLELM